MIPNTHNMLIGPGRLSPEDEFIKYNIEDVLKTATVTKTVETNNIADTLAERGSRYGKFTGHAKIAQSLKSVMQATSNWAILSDDQKESLEMVAHKIGRILNGDPNYDDSWIDIAGYSKLVADRLTKGIEQ